MNKIKFFVMTAALVVCTTASAQFSNTGTRNNQRTTRTSMGGAGLDGNGPEAGYKGFIEAGYTVGVGDYGEGRIALTTTHGYQINPYVFTGIGAGVNYFTDADAWGVPIFADIRANILNNSISPFIDMKIGYSITDVEGFYFNPSVGCRFGFRNNSAFTLSIGYEMQKADFYGYYAGYYYEDSENCGGLTIKLGFDF